jgi:hypothetical protein
MAKSCWPSLSYLARTRTPNAMQLPWNVLLRPSLEDRMFKESVEKLMKNGSGVYRAVAGDCERRLSHVERLPRGVANRSNAQPNSFSTAPMTPTFGPSRIIILGSATRW